MNWRELCEEADALSEQSTALREEARRLWEKEQERKQIAMALREAATVLEGGKRGTRGDL